MTKKEVLRKFNAFTNGHSPDEFEGVTTTINEFAAYVCPRNERISKITWENIKVKLVNWWRTGKTPLTEERVMSLLDPGKVTHKWAKMTLPSEDRKGCVVNNEFNVEHLWETMSDWSFKYSIIGVDQRPGQLWLNLWWDKAHQTNITGEVIDKIAKCLEF